MDPSPTHLGTTRSDAVWTYVLLGGGGALLLGLLPLLLGWLGGFPFVPFRDALDWAAGFDEPWADLARPVVGLVAGLASAAVVLHTEHRLEVFDDRLVIVRGADQRTIERDAVVGVHRDGKRVVVDGQQGRRVFGEKVEASRERVRSAFEAHGWPYESS